MPDIRKITTVIFDLGGVILNLDQPASYKAFAHMSGKAVEEVQALAAKESFFEEYEVGKIDDPTFRAHLRQTLDIFNSDDELDAVWNAMLRGIPLERLQLLETMKADYRLFMLSNTNDIHFRQIERIARHVVPGKGIRDYFEHAYLSQEIGERKPNAEAWQIVIEEQELEPATTLFIDDGPANIEAAAKLGLQTFHNVRPDDWMALFLP